MYCILGHLDQGKRIGQSQCRIAMKRRLAYLLSSLSPFDEMFVKRHLLKDEPRFHFAKRQTTTNSDMGGVFVGGGCRHGNSG